MIRLAWPDVNFKDVEKDYKEIIASGQLTSGRFVKKFENELAKYIGTKYAVATTSATTALHLSLVVAGIKEGDEVLVADFTHPATGNVVIEVGAVPILIDVDPETFCLDFDDLKKKVTKKTKAIIPVDPFGFPANLKAIVDFADKNKIVVIEDAATALGASVSGRMCGSWGIAGCFSFHPRKTITTGEGGMITTNDKRFAQEAYVLRNHGGTLEGKNNIYTFRKAGFNYRMSEIQAALGVVQMKKINEFIEKRKYLVLLYKELLSESPLIKFQKEPSWGKGVYQSFVILLDKKINRNKVITDMKDKGVETTLGTYALHAQPAYKDFGYREGDLKNSYLAFTQTLTLPLHTHLTKEDIKYICKSLEQVIKDSR